MTPSLFLPGSLDELEAARLNSPVARADFAARSALALFGLQSSSGPFFALILLGHDQFTA